MRRVQGRGVVCILTLSAKLGISQQIWCQGFVVQCDLVFLSGLFYQSFLGFCIFGRKVIGQYLFLGVVRKEAGEIRKVYSIFGWILEVLYIRYVFRSFQMLYEIILIGGFVMVLFCCAFKGQILVVGVLLSVMLFRVVFFVQGVLRVRFVG